MSNVQGSIAQIIGPVVDVIFNESALPKIYEALEIEKAGGQMFHAACSCTFLVAHRHVGLQNFTLSHGRDWMTELGNARACQVRLVSRR